MSKPEPKNSSSSPTLWIVGLLVIVIVLLIALRRPNGPANESHPDKPTRPASSSASFPSIVHHARSSAESPTLSAEEIVAKKLVQFSRNRRAVFEAMARKHNVAVPEQVKRFFDALDAGNWPEANAIYKALRAAQSSGDPQADEIKPFMRPITEAHGAAERAQNMPAQQYLDYGNAILDSLKPGMVYVGGTDPGCFIPTMLNATSDGEQHITLTQNALADNSYLDYLQFLYGDQLKNLSADDRQQSFNDYMADAQKRLLHDQQFPDEPKQVLPGEDIKMEDGHVSISGSIAVMSINERLLQTLMQKNPDLSFGLEESFPLKSTYGGAALLGPIMELNAPGGANAFTADTAAQTLNYWQNTAQQLLADPEATASIDTMKTYSHDIAAQANLLAAHDFNAQAEQAYRLATQLVPANFEATAGLADVLNRTGHTGQAIQVLNDFAKKNPTQQAAVDKQRSTLTAKAK